MTNSLDARVLALHEACKVVAAADVLLKRKAEDPIIASSRAKVYQIVQELGAIPEVVVGHYNYQNQVTQSCVDEAVSVALQDPETAYQKLSPRMRNPLSTRSSVR